MLTPLSRQAGQAVSGHSLDVRPSEHPASHEKAVIAAARLGLQVPEQVWRDALQLTRNRQCRGGGCSTGVHRPARVVTGRRAPPRREPARRRHVDDKGRVRRVGDAARAAVLDAGDAEAATSDRCRPGRTGHGRAAAPRPQALPRAGRLGFDARGGRRPPKFEIAREAWTKQREAMAAAARAVGGTARHDPGHAAIAVPEPDAPPEPAAAEVNR